MQVVVLEQGDWPDYSQARADHPDFELTMGRYWSGNPNRRQAPADYPIDDRDSDISAVLFNAVGGGTVIYAAHWQRNMPSDFRVRTLDGVADDWPLTYEDLAPFYERVEADFGVSGLAGDPAFPPGKGPPLPPAPLGPMGRRVALAHNQLGWHWWPGPNAIATRAYGPLKPCQQRATCMWGCVEGAKGSVDITHWPQLVERGARLVTGARVGRLETNADGLATGAEYIDRNGQVHFQKAAVIMIAANGIGTPRLLLNSASAQFPNGLANSSGLVGRRLMLHPFGTVVGLFDERPRQHARFVGPAHSLPRILRDRHVTGFRARREVGPSAHWRPAFDDARLSVGRGERDLGNRLSSATAETSWPFRHVGHHCRRFA